MTDFLKIWEPSGRQAIVRIISISVFDDSVGGDRHSAASTGCLDEGALRGYGRPCLGVVHDSEHLCDPLIASPSLDGQRALSGVGDAEVGSQYLCCLVQPAQPFQSGGSEDDAVAAVRTDFGQPGVDVSACRDKLDVWTDGQQLPAASWAARPKSRAGGKVGETQPPPVDDYVPGVFALRVGSDGKAVG